MPQMVPSQRLGSGCQQNAPVIFSPESKPRRFAIPSDAGARVAMGREQLEPFRRAGKVLFCLMNGAFSRLASGCTFSSGSDSRMAMRSLLSISAVTSLRTKNLKTLLPW